MSRLLSHASGDMYCGVPSNTPAAVLTAVPAENTLASPKSSTLTKSCSPSRAISMMLSGFRSRWMMPAAWGAGGGARGARARDLRADVQRAHHVERLVARQHRRQRPALEVLHDVEVIALGRHAEVVDLDDVLVADLVVRG